MASVAEVSKRPEAALPPQWDAAPAASSQACLFFVHDGASDDCVPALSAGLDGGPAVHALRVEAGMPDTVEAIATQLLAQLLLRQPRGPYKLAAVGACGVLAYEMAVQLVGQDQAVSFIGLVDTDCPPWPSGQDVDPAAEATRHGGASLRDAIRNYAIQPAPLCVHLVESASRQAMAQATAASPLEPSGWTSLVSSVRLWKLDAASTGDAEFAMSAAAALSQALAASRPAAPASPHGAHVIIQSGKPGQAPLLCVPGAGDSVIGFIPMAEALSAQYPLHGLQPRGVDGLLVPHATVEAAASFYLDATAAQRRDGPVHLVGHSFGGWVAFEMALQLRARGEPVQSLTIIDAESPDSVGVLGGQYSSTGVLVELIRVMEMSAGKDFGIDMARFKASPRGVQLQMLHEGMVRVGMLPRRSEASTLRGLTRTFGTALRTTYKPRRCLAGPVGLVLARDPDHPGEQEDLLREEMLQGWKRFAPDLIAWNCPGDHFSVLRKPQVQALAAWWQATMSQGRSELRVIGF